MLDLQARHQILDETPRLVKMGDAFSQLLNVSLLPNHRSTTANESISGRCHRMGWKRAEFIIDFIFFRLGQGPHHCRDSYLADLSRASLTLLAHGQSVGGQRE